MLLTNFKRCEGEVIRSANKKKSADIEIDGVGDLYLILNNNKIKLTNVIAAENIANNLISLRRFVDEGLSIYLDDKKMEIFDKNTREIFVTGKYEKPNWTITFEVTSKLDNNESKYEIYSCIAQIGSPEEFLTQSQTVNRSINLQKPEGEKDVHSCNLEVSEIGREIQKEIPLENSPNDLESIDFDLDEQTLNRKILDLNSISGLDEINKNKIVELKPEEAQLTKLDVGMLWHKRLGHPSLGYLKKLKGNNEFLKNVKFDDNILDCEICIKSKMTKLPFNKDRVIADRPLHTIHIDTMGQFRIASFPGSYKYILVILDDYSRFAKIYCIKNKSESAKCLDNFITTVRNLIGKNEKVCYIRTDNAKEFTGGEFLEVMEKEKIEGDFAPPYTPELNGTAERFNRTIQQIITSLMIESGLPRSMWVLAAETAVNLYNRTPHKTNNFEIPLLKLNPKLQTHFDKIRRFGCLAYIKLPTTENKFAEKAIKSVLVGYSRTGYILWEPTSGKFITSRHVKFNEKLTYKDAYKTENSNLEESISVSEKELLEEKNQNTENVENLEEKVQKRGRPKKRKLEEKEIEESESKKLRISSRKPKPNKDENFVYVTNTENIENKLEEDEIRYAFLASIDKVPSNYKEAMSCEEKEKYALAIIEEKKSIEGNDVFEVVERPNGIKILTSRWLFVKKLGSNGKWIHKARLVARGFQDNNWYELCETYAPVSRLALIRMALSIINKYNLEARQLDVKTAFLNGELKRDIYMEIPEGYECSDEFRRNNVWKLKRSLYGLSVSPKLWNEKFTKAALELGLENDINEPCLFTWRKDGNFAMVVVYVDDMFIASNLPEKVEEIVQHFSAKFEMKDMGEPEFYLGMKIQRNRDKQEMVISQPEYTEKILERFEMKKCNPQETPMVTKQVKSRNIRSVENLEESALTKAPYRAAIGSLLYLAGATRPDIAFAVNLLASRQNAPTEEDWKDVKRIFRYLRGTSDLGLHYKGKTEDLEALSDASFRDREKSTSTSGYVIRLYGDTVAWRSHKQKLTQTSTCAVEYLAMSEACKEVISLDKALRDITGKTMYPVTLRCDNMAAGKCTQMEGNHKLKDFDDDIATIKSKLEVRESTGKKLPITETHGDYVKACVKEGKIKVEWISTKLNVADIMTKPLPSDSHKKFRNEIMNLEK